VQRSRCLAVALLLPVLAGCRDSGPSMDDWREDAAAACKARDDALKAIAPPTQMSEISAVAVQWADTSEKARAAIFAADRPDGAEAKPAEELTMAMGAAIESLRPWADVVRGEDLVAIETGVDEVVEKARAADAKAEAAGVLGCATTSVLMEQPLRGAAKSGAVAAFKKKIEGICPKLEGEHRAVLDKLEGEPWGARVLVYLDTMAADLRALSVPQAARSSYDEYLKVLDEFREQMRSLRLDVVRMGEKAVADKIDELLDRMGSWGSILGLGPCRLGPAST
jgi:hypothetical protein